MHYCFGFVCRFECNFVFGTNDLTKDSIIENSELTKFPISSLVALNKTVFRRKTIHHFAFTSDFKSR